MNGASADVLIVGAGLAGVMAARTLHGYSFRTLLLDKGRSVGGRMATRRIGEGRADTGAQFFTARDPAFQQQVAAWVEAGHVFEWSRGWSDGHVDALPDGFPRYAASGGMNALVRELAHGLEVHLNTQISTIERVDAGWRLTDTGGDSFESQSLVMTPPVPQSLALLGDIVSELDARERDLLQSVQYEKCIALLAEVGDDVALPQPGAIQRPGESLTWAADNQRKGISKTRILTLHMGPEFSDTFYDQSDEAVLERAHGPVASVVSAVTLSPQTTQVKRWRYARPVSMLDGYFLLTHVPQPGGATLLFAGDMFSGARVEGAYLSGVRGGAALAEALLSSPGWAASASER